jgi:hypothetical protein
MKISLANMYSLPKYIIVSPGITSPLAGESGWACVGADAAAPPIAAKNIDIDNAALRYVPTTILFSLLAPLAK